MATVTLHWTNGIRTSFETSHPRVIARYQGYADRDPGIERMTVLEPWDAGLDDTSG